MRVLIVEDNPVNREFLSAVMEEHGRCETVECGEEALDLVRKAHEESDPYRLIFMDIVLPGIDGLQALEQIRDLEKRLEVPREHTARAIVTTAIDDERKVSRAFFHGDAIAYITKPLTVAKVTSELKKFGLLS